MEGVELLVHNLSHSDLVLDVNNIDLGIQPNEVIARPKFSKFKQISEDILHKISAEESQIDLYSISPYLRASSTFSAESKVPIGFNLQLNPVEISDLTSLRFRQDDASKIRVPVIDDNLDVEKRAVACIQSVYFPLIAVLLPKWLNSIQDGRKSLKKVVVIVSGRGTPVDKSAAMSDNSTKYTGKLIELFINRAYPNVEVKLVHSTSNLFRYDHNIVFVKRQLLPVMDSYRDQLVETVGGRWKENMRVSLSFADGSSARISAINASLRHYR